MRTAVFLIACIVLSAHAGHLENIFAEVSNTKFGKTMVDSIMVEIESGSSVDELISNIRGVTKGLKQQESDARAVAENKHDACDTDLRSLADGATKGYANQEKFAGLGQADEVTLKNRQAEFASKAEQIKARKAMLATLQKERTKEKKQYKAIKAEYEKVYGVLDDVRAIIQARLVAGSQSFLQSKTSIQTAVLDRLRTFKTSNRFGIFIKLLSKVVAHSAKVHADQAVVQKLFDIVDRVEENLDAAAALEREAEHQRAEAFADISERVNDLVLTYRDEMVDLKGFINALAGRISNSKQRYSEAIESTHSFEARLADRQAECKQDQAIWENFYQNMQKELSTAAKLMYLLEDKRHLLQRLA